MPETTLDETTLERPTAIERYSWHEAHWTTLVREIERLPHALLFHGPAGVGKRMFARRLAFSLVCAARRPDGEACGACRNCQLFQAGTHPDFTQVNPAEPGKSIVIDQIRALHDFLVLRPHSASYKIALIAPAEAMNLNAANSLLKLLEEPPPDSVLVLTSHQPERLPATIRSRCNATRFHVPAIDQATAWLRHRDPALTQYAQLLAWSGGAPLAALELGHSGFQGYSGQLLEDIQALRQGRMNPVACAVSWQQIGSQRCLSWFYGFIADLIKVAMDPEAGRHSGSGKHPIDLIGFANGLNLKQLFELLDLISRSKSQIGGPLDEKLLLEEIFIRWYRAQPRDVTHTANA